MTIAQQLKIKEFPFEIKDSRDQYIYREEKNGFWEKREYDAQGNKIRYESSDGYWTKSEYDVNGNEIRFEEFDGYWEKREYDTHGNTIYYENRNGRIYDKRPKTEISMDEIAAKFGIPVSELKIKK